MFINLEGLQVDQGLYACLTVLAGITYLLYKKYLFTPPNLRYYRSISKRLEGIEFVEEPFYHLKIKSPKICRQIYSKPMALPTNLGLGDLFGRWLGSCMGNLDIRDPAWGGLKRVFKPLFLTKNSKIEEELVKEWDTHLESLHTKSRGDYIPTNLEEIIDDLPLRFILRLTFGKTFLARHREEFQTLQKCAQHLMWAIFNNPYARWRSYRYLFTTETNKALIKFQATWDWVLDRARSDKAVADEGLYRNMYEAYLESKAHVGGALDFQMFSQTLIEIIYANQDVAIPSLAWLITHYIQHDKLLDSTEPLNFIEESARMAPIFPTSMPKTLTSDMVIDSCTIKKNTTVCIDFIGIGKCGNEWQMTDLDTFRPNRFIEVVGEVGDFVSRFGYGGRRCPGRKVANMLFVKVIQTLCNRWTFIPVKPLSNRIETDPARPFLMPKMTVWIDTKSTGRAGRAVDKELLFYCPPFAKVLENSFVGISVNKKSPYCLAENCNALIQHIASDMKACVSWFGGREKEEPKECVIMIADQIAHYNLQAFEKYKPAKAMREALKMGDLLMANFGKAIAEYGNYRIKVCRWSDLNVPDIEKDLAQFDLLDKRVTFLAQRFLQHRDKNGQSTKKSTERKLKWVKKYIYSELPVLVCGICYKDRWRRLLYYSGSLAHLKKFAQDDQSLHNLILDIIYKPQFKDVKAFLMEKMGTDRAKVPGFIGLDITAIAPTTNRNK